MSPNPMSPTLPRTRSRSLKKLTATAVISLCLAASLAGCGDDDVAADTPSTTAPAADDTTTTADSGDSDDHAHDDQVAAGSFCSAYTEITLMMSGEPDPAALTANLEVVRESAPAEVADSVTVMADAVDAVLASMGEDFSAMETPEFMDAQGTVDPFVFENCGSEFDATYEVIGRDYAFDGLPQTFDGGRVALLFTNEGAEAHEIAIVRRHEGVTESFEELLSLPDEEVMTKATFVGAAFAAANGSSGLLLGDFEPGDYLAICFVSVGTTMVDGQMTEGTGDPHFMHGMQQEFTVTG